MLLCCTGWAHVWNRVAAFLKSCSFFFSCIHTAACWPWSTLPSGILSNVWRLWFLLTMIHYQLQYKWEEAWAALLRWVLIPWGSTSSVLNENLKQWNPSHRHVGSYLCVEWAPLCYVQCSFHTLHKVNKFMQHVAECTYFRNIHYGIFCAFYTWFDLISLLLCSDYL